jgi:hypothetical protein
MGTGIAIGAPSVQIGALRGRGEKRGAGLGARGPQMRDRGRGGIAATTPPPDRGLTPLGMDI